MTKINIYPKHLSIVQKTQRLYFRERNIMLKTKLLCWAMVLVKKDIFFVNPMSP